MKNFALLLALVTSLACAAEQPVVEARQKSTLTLDGLRFRDLNANAQLDPYEDWRLPVEARAADLIARLSVEEKAGLMLHASVQGFTGPNGIVLDQRIPIKVRGVEIPAPPSTTEFVDQRHVHWLLLRAWQTNDVAAATPNLATAAGKS